MTERQWLTVVDPEAMLTWASERVSDRKLRLYAIACCRRLAHYFDARYSAALAEAAALADETPPKPRRAGRTARRHDTDLLHSLSDARAHTAAWLAADRAIATATVRGGMAWEERLFQASCLIDLLGNPFRKVRFEEKWRTETAVALAQQFYDRGEAASLPRPRGRTRRGRVRRTRGARARPRHPPTARPRVLGGRSGAGQRVAVFGVAKVVAALFESLTPPGARCRLRPLPSPCGPSSLG